MEQTRDSIIVVGDQDCEFNYFVNGVRRGYTKHESIVDNDAYVPMVRGVPFGTQYPRDLRDILVQNGTLNADYTPNEATAVRLGWKLVSAEDVPPSQRYWLDRETRQALISRGAKHGESVAILHPNGRDGLVALYAALYGGFRAAMINLAAGPDAIAYALDHSEARFAFVHDSATDTFKAAEPGRIEACGLEDTPTTLTCLRSSLTTRTPSRAYSSRSTHVRHTANPIGKTQSERPSRQNSVACVGLRIAGL